MSKKRLPAKPRPGKHRRENHPGTMAPGESLLEARTRKEIAFANTMELAAERRRAELIPRDQAVALLQKEIEAAKEILGQMGARLAQPVANEADPAKVEALIDAEARRALEQLAQRGNPFRDSATEPTDTKSIVRRKP